MCVCVCVCVVLNSADSYIPTYICIYIHTHIYIFINYPYLSGGRVKEEEGDEDEVFV